MRAAFRASDGPLDGRTPTSEGEAAVTLAEQLREHLDHQEACGWHLDWPEALTALRAVLKLHQPERARADEDALVCAHCVDAYEEPVKYPCLTVQDVAEALKVRHEQPVEAGR